MNHLPPGYRWEDELQATPAAAAPDAGGLPPGYSWEDEDAAPESSPQQELTVPSPGLFKGMTTTLEQGFTFGIGEEVGAAGTASGAALKNWVAGKPANWVEEYERAIGEGRARMKAFEKEHPVAAVGSEIFGAAASLPGAGAKFIAKGAGLLGKAGRSIPVGAGTGAVYGAGKAEGGPAERTIGAAKGGAVGAVLAPVATVAMTGVAKIIEFGARAIPNSATREGAMKVAQALFRDNITVQQAKTRLRQIGAHGIIADISENVRNVAGAAARIPGKTRDVATRMLNQRQRHQHNRIVEYTRKALGAEGGYFKKTTDLMDARETAASPFYEEAYKANQSMMTPEISRILETPNGRRALRIAATKMRNDRSRLGEQGPELTVAAREAAARGQMKPVEGGVMKGLNLRTLDYVKRAMDDQIQVLRKAGRRDDARILRNSKNDMLQEMDAADVTRTEQTIGWAGTPRGADNPGAYQNARRIYAGHSESLESLEKGRNFIKGDVEVTTRDIADMTPADRAFFREGVNQRVTDLVKSKREGADKVAALLRTPAMREKLAATFESPRAYAQWMREMLGEEKMGRTLRQLGGSPTAERLETSSDFSGALLRDVIWGAKGNPFAQMRMFGHAASGLKGPPREAVAEALAPMFTNDPAKQQAFLAMIQRMTAPAGAQAGLPPLLGQLAASQGYRPGIQEGAVGIPLALYEELIKTAQGGSPQ